MADSHDARLAEAFGPLPDVPGFSQQTLHTYVRLWQFEKWLRRVVYLERKAAAGDEWAQPLRPVDNAKNADKRLSHMSTPEDSPLSFAQLSDLLRVIRNEWRLFSTYFPPQNIWDAKCEEIVQTRHRIAHFRRGHADDLQRLIQLLRDIDAGIWRFCTTYNDPEPVLPQSDDPVVHRFLELDPFPWSRVGDKSWARVGVADPTAPLGVTVETLCRPWATRSTRVDGAEGWFYDVRIHARGQRYFNYRQLLEATTALHEHLAHIVLEFGAHAIRVTVPAVLGSAMVTPLVERFVEASRYALQSGTWPGSDRDVQMFADGLPEYVLGPEDPLSLLSPEMRCSIFEV